KTMELEEKTDRMNKEFRKKQIRRLKEEKCNPEASVLYSEMLTDFERIGDHALNIAQNYDTM
ncbi:MAG: PhoU domain-containing protein, partial [Lachnospiraceae bacterium]